MSMVSPKKSLSNKIERINKPVGTKEKKISRGHKNIENMPIIYEYFQGFLSLRMKGIF